MAINNKRKKKKKKYEGMAANFKEIRHYFLGRHKIRVGSSWTTVWQSNLEHPQLQLLDCSVLFWTKTRRYNYYGSRVNKVRKLDHIQLGTSTVGYCKQADEPRVS